MIPSLEPLYVFLPFRTMKESRIPLLVNLAGTSKMRDLKAFRFIAMKGMKLHINKYYGANAFDFK